MKPIAPPSILTKGIAVYIPPLMENSRGIVNVAIYYTKSNPLFSWLTCETSRVKLWSKSVEQTKGGSLFLYEQELALGFYILQASLIKPDSSTIQGQMSLGLITPTPYIIVGLPYSIYPPISMS